MKFFLVPFRPQKGAEAKPGTKSNVWAMHPTGSGDRFILRAVVLPKFSGKSCHMMRVKTLSKDRFASVEVYRKEKRYFHFRLSRVAQNHFCSLFPPHWSIKKKWFLVCIKSVSEHLNKILVLWCFFVVVVVYLWFELVLRSLPFPGKRK